MSVLTLVAALAAASVPGWTPIPAPGESSDLMYCANYSERRTVVSHDGAITQVHSRGRPQHAALPFDAAGLGIHPSDTRYVHPVKDGWLVGIDRGEFGDALWWISRDARTRRQITVPRELKRGALLGWTNPAGFADYEGDIFLMTGLDHLGTGLGRMFRVESVDSGWALTEVAQFEGTPQDWFEDASGALVVLTHRGVYTYTAGSTRRLTTVDLGTVRPLTIGTHRPGGYLIGTRLFLVALEPQNDAFREQWYLPADCPSPKVDMANLECDCAVVATPRPQP